MESLPPLFRDRPAKKHEVWIRPSSISHPFHRKIWKVKMRRKEGESFPVCFFSSFLDRDYFFGKERIAVFGSGPQCEVPKNFFLSPSDAGAKRQPKQRKRKTKDKKGGVGIAFCHVPRGRGRRRGSNWQSNLSSFQREEDVREFNFLLSVPSSFLPVYGSNAIPIKHGDKDMGTLWEIWTLL